MFELNQNANISGTHLVGIIKLPPRDIVKAFGYPNQAYPYKVSGQYVFTDNCGQVFTLYDWKMTSLYDPDYINPIDLWAETTPQVLNIGGHDSPIVFIKWLESKVLR